MDADRRHPNYLAVWGGLFALTVIEVAAVYMRIPRHLLVLALLLLAAWKALLGGALFHAPALRAEAPGAGRAGPLPLGVILVVAVLQEFAKR